MFKQKPKTVEIPEIDSIWEIKGYNPYTVTSIMITSYKYSNTGICWVELDYENLPSNSFTCKFSELKENYVKRP